MQANLASKTDFNNKPISLNRKLPQIKKIFRSFKKSK